MGRFQDSLRTEIHSVKYKNRPCELLEDFTYITNEGPEITVPVGYRSDFASVPRFFWRVFPPMGKYSHAAIVHDYLCDIKHPRGYKWAAKVFKEAMQDLGVGRFKRNAMHRAVVAFGPKF
jgi:hypothetical protein